MASLSRIAHHTLRLVIAWLALSVLVACGEAPVEKRIIGTWVQDAPIAMTDQGVESVTSGTALELEQDGDVRLRRVLSLRGAGLPEGGIELDVDLAGRWTFREGELVQTLERALITPRTAGDDAAKLADALQTQAQSMNETVKTIISVTKTELILQDQETGLTDSYRRD